MSGAADSGRVNEGSTMTVNHIRLGLVALVAALGLLVALPAGARGPTFLLRDAVGDAQGGAADIASISIWNEDDGTVTFELAFANRSALTPDDLVAVMIDTDDNLDNGGAGAEFGVLLTHDSQTFLRYDGSDWVSASSRLARPGTQSISLHRNDLGGVKELGVSAFAVLESDDVSFDETGYGPFLFYVPARLAGSTLTVSPARATLAVGTRVTAKVAVRLDDGTTARPTAATCRMTLAGQAIKPVAPCAWKLPKAATGKRVVVSARGSYNGTAFTTKQVVIRVR
jgi:hypothetical protein